MAEKAGTADASCKNVDVPKNVVQFLHQVAAVKVMPTRSIVFFVEVLSTIPNDG